MSHAPNQQHLGNVIKQLFPNFKIVNNARKAANVLSPTGLYLELDFWLPELHLGFEFQDAHHYTSTGYRFTHPKHTIERDSLKKKLVDDKGDTLVVVPCWWDGNVESLIATIRKERPDVLNHLSVSSISSFSSVSSAKPIPDKPPDDFFKKKQIPNIGELMTASIPLDNRIDINLWWISEKYDGIRFCWNHNTKSLYSRNGISFRLPSFFTFGFPQCCIDGELWCGRETYLELQTIMRKRGESASPSATSSFLRFIAFDEPSLQTRNLANLQYPSDSSGDLQASLTSFQVQEWKYETRFTTLLSSISIHHPNIIPITSCKSKGREHMKEFVAKVINNGGEGMIVREPESFYVAGLSDSLFKFKAERDQEGLVVAVHSSSYTLRLPDGKLLEIDKKRKKKEIEDDNEEESTYTDEEEQEEEKEKKNNKRETQKKKSQYQIGDVVTFTFSHYDLAGLPARAKLQRKREDVRWEDVVLCFWDKSNSAKHLGEISQKVLEPIVQERKPIGHWTIDGSKNIRKFFDDLAHSWNKDPLNPETWYRFGMDDLAKAKGVSILRHYGNSVIKVLMNVYPNIGLDELQFDRVSHKFWDSEANRKLFFDNFAKKKGFDPLVPENWYKVTRSSIEAEKGAYVLQRGGYLVSSLMTLYPDIGLEPSKFTFIHKWKDTDFHIKFFKSFAKKHNFDPLVPDNWYNISKRDILEMKGAFTVLSTFNGSFKRALFSSFPDIGIQEEKFAIVRPRYWVATENRRSFFDSFAFDRGFDPLVAENWYAVTMDDIKNKSGKHILKHCGNSLSRALVDSYPDIGLELSAFRIIPKKHWETPANSRRFLDNFAEQHGFDPLLASNWYSITSDDIQKEKGGLRFLTMNNNSVVSAIVNTYPDIGIQEYKFTNYSRHFWTKENNLKRFFDQYAAKKAFDPLSPSLWYSVSPDDIRSEDKGYSVLQRHGGSLVKALKHAYPSLVFEDNKFTPSRVWMDSQHNRREFFDNFAKKMNFDPLKAKNWISFSKRTLIKEKRGKYCIAYYEGSLEKALMDVYKFSKIV